MLAQANFSVVNHGVQWRTDTEGMSESDRLDAILTNLNSLRIQVDTLQGDTTARISALTETISTERTERISLQGSFFAKLEALGAGSIPFEFMGLAWLVIGMLLSTVPGEIGRLLPWLK